MVAVGEKEDIADDPEIPDRPEEGGAEGVDDGHQPEGHGGQQADHQKQVYDKGGDGFGYGGHGCSSLLPGGGEMGRQRRNTVPVVAEEEKSTLPPRKVSPKSFMV